MFYSPFSLPTEKKLSMIKAIITDIEGTTTSISFVAECLFPYAKKHLPEFLNTHLKEPDIAAIIDDIKQLNTDLNDIDAVIVQCIEWIETDQKVTPLKTLQGHIWKHGYQRGELKGHLYAEVSSFLERWHSSGIQLGVYSSGSVAAQKLLFAHSAAGDLTPLFNHYFDTNIGHKRDVSAYEAIVKALNLPPNEILFLSDISQELEAAQSAGLQILGLDRDGLKLPDDYVWCKDFTDVDNFLKSQNK
jgi:enolase-phosphatase E1